MHWQVSLNCNMYSFIILPCFVGCRFPQDTLHSQPTPWST